MQADIVALADDDWEIWVYRPGYADDITTHILVAAELDQQTAITIMNKVNKLVITRQAPDIVLYIRRPFDFTYRIKLNARTTRTRFTRASARDLFDAYKRTFMQPKYVKHWSCRLVQVNNIAARNNEPDMAFLPRVLRRDPVYGERPLILRDPGPLYFGEPITFEYVQAIINTVDSKKIAQIVAAIFTAYKNRQLAKESKVRMLPPRRRYIRNR